MLALYLGIQHFHYFLEGQQFTAHTDHKPPSFSMPKSSDPLSKRQQKQLVYKSEFTTDIQHVVGHNNLVAVTLSRPTIADVQAVYRLSCMAITQQEARKYKPAAPLTRVCNNKIYLLDQKGSYYCVICPQGEHDPSFLLAGEEKF